MSNKRYVLEYNLHQKETNWYLDLMVKHDNGARCYRFSILTYLIYY